MMRSKDPIELVVGRTACGQKERKEAAADEERKGRREKVRGADAPTLVKERREETSEKGRGQEASTGRDRKKDK